jgi:hypothetical protein
MAFSGLLHHECHVGCIERLSAVFFPIRADVLSIFGIHIGELSWWISGAGGFRAKL